MARSVAADVLQHVAQLGNRHQTVLFVDADHRFYTDPLRSNGNVTGVAIRVWRLG